MNFNKLNKKELITQIQNLQENAKTKVSAQKESLFRKSYNFLINYLTDILKLFNVIKEVLFKLTFITFFMKLILKYNFIRKIINILRKVLFLGLGTSFLEYFAVLDIFRSIWEYIMIIIDYIFSWIKMYLNWLISLWETKSEEETPEPEVNFITNYEYENEKEEIKKGNLSTSKILIITSIILCSCFIYIYFDDLRDWIKPSDPGPSADIVSILETKDKIELVNKVTPESRWRKGLFSDYLNDPLKNISQEINNASTSKVRLEDLHKITTTDETGNELYHEIINNSPTNSDSSIETITPASVRSTSIETISQINSWRDNLVTSTKETINYVENHFPDSELSDNIDYIKKLIKDVNKNNMNFANITVSLKESLTIDQMRERLEIAKKTQDWVNDMLERLKPFE